MTEKYSVNADDSIKYWNEAWLDELIEEAFRLANSKSGKEPSAIK